MPVTLGLAFVLTTAFAVGLLYRATHCSRRLLGALLGWLGLQGALAVSGFYTVTTSLPPRLPLALVPTLAMVVGLFATARGRNWLDGLRLDVLTLLHVVRVPVELVLFGLFLQGAVPQLMTFEGRNWDVLAGLTAPVVAYLAFRKKVVGRKGLLLWNILSLASLLNILVNALLSVPSPIQRFAFEQPNVAVLHFPYVWLPACVVPIVLLAHLAAIRQLTRKATAPSGPLSLMAA